MAGTTTTLFCLFLCRPTHAAFRPGHVKGSGARCVYFSAKLYSKKAHARWIETADENTLTLGAPVHFSDLARYVKDNNLFVKLTYSAIIGGAPEASPGLTHLPPGIKPGVDEDIRYALNGVVIKTDEKQIIFSGPNACLAVYENILVKMETEISLSDVLSKTIEHDGKERFSFIGRSDLLINRDGQKISLEKIENLLSGQFNCRCVAIPFYDARLGQDIAFILEALRYDCSFNLQSIQAFVENDCGFKIPSTHILFETIPLNANSKFDRKEALKIYLKQRTWKFPIDVGYAKLFLPHYGPAVWIDKIIKTEKILV